MLLLLLPIDMFDCAKIYALLGGDAAAVAYCTTQVDTFCVAVGSGHVRKKKKKKSTPLGVITGASVPRSSPRQGMYNAAPRAPQSMHLFDADCGCVHEAAFWHAIAA